MTMVVGLGSGSVIKHPNSRAQRQELSRIIKADVQIQSIDACQGQEYELVIVSMTRANEDRSLGHTADPRRLNVACTRPRRGLILVGHYPTLVAGDTEHVVSDLAEQCLQRGVIMNEKLETCDAPFF